MPVRVRVLDARPEGFPQPGDAWPLPEGEPYAPSIHQRAYRAGERPLVVKLPDETELNLGATPPGGAVLSTGEGFGYRLTGEGDTLGVEALLVGRKGWRGYLREGQLWAEAEVRVVKEEVPDYPKASA